MRWVLFLLFYSRENWGVAWGQRVYVTYPKSQSLSRREKSANVHTPRDCQAQHCIKLKAGDLGGTGVCQSDRLGFFYPLQCTSLVYPLQEWSQFSVSIC